MSKPKYINLNLYESVSEIPKDADGSYVIITPKKKPGTDIPDLLFRRARSDDEPILYSDVSNVIWNPDVRISNKGTYEEYSNRIEWWFTCAKNHRGYQKSLMNRYRTIIENGFSIDKIISDVIVDMRLVRPEARKTNIRKHFERELINAAKEFMDVQSRRDC